MSPYMPTPSTNGSFSRKFLEIEQERKAKTRETKRKGRTRWKGEFPQKTENSEKNVWVLVLQKNAIKLGKFCQKWPQATHLARASPYIYIYVHIQALSLSQFLLCLLFLDLCCCLFFLLFSLSLSLSHSLSLSLSLFLLSLSLSFASLALLLSLDIPSWTSISAFQGQVIFWDFICGAQLASMTYSGCVAAVQRLALVLPLKKNPCFISATAAPCHRQISSLLCCRETNTEQASWDTNLAHQNRTIAIASNFPRWRSRIARNPAERKGFRLRNRSSKSQIVSDFPSQPEIAMQHCCVLSRKSVAISVVRDGHRDRKSQKSLRFWCAKP